MWASSWRFEFVRRADHVAAGDVDRRVAQFRPRLLDVVGYV
jgi:hypothetical protein